MASSGIDIGYCLSNFVGPLVFKPQDAPQYELGFTVTFVTAVVRNLLALVYHCRRVAINKKYDRTGMLEGCEHACKNDLTDHKNPHFRYIL